jgi:hypothetical protein
VIVIVVDPVEVRSEAGIEKVPALATIVDVRPVCVLAPVRL